MENLRTHSQALRWVLAARPCGLVVDVDGTIAPIARLPAEASVSPVCRDHLAAMIGILDLVAVISGRPAREAQRMLGLPGVSYLGCHGLETLQDSLVILDPAAAPYLKKVRRAAEELTGRLSGQPGLDGLLVEDKGICVTFHYRACRDHERARLLVLEAAENVVRRKGGVQVIEARRAVELVPKESINKGTALLAIAKEHNLRAVCYLGDDLTDLAAFRALRAWREDTGCRGLAVAVAGAETPADVLEQGDLVLDGISAVEEFLGLLRKML